MSSSLLAQPVRARETAPPPKTLRDLAIYGSEYRDVVKLVDAINRGRAQWRLRGFIDDRPERQGASVLGVPVIGDRSRLAALAAEGTQFFCNVSGKVADARAVAGVLAHHTDALVSLVHPAVDMAYVEIGPGCILPEGCVVGSGTRIGRQLSARLHVVISHDVVIEDYVFIGPGTVVGSEAWIEEGAFLGAGVTVMTGCRIGRHSIIGAGALVTKDVPAGVTVGGARGQIIRGQGRV